MPPIRKRRKVWVKHDLIGCLLPNSHMCSLTPPANTISPLPDSPPLYLYTLSTLGATSRANQPSNDACFPDDSDDKESNSGRRWVFCQLQRKGWSWSTKPSHLPPLFPASAWEPLPAAQCRVVCQSPTPPALHPSLSPISEKYPLKDLQRGSYQQLNPPTCHTITPTW